MIELMPWIRTINKDKRLNSEIYFGIQVFTESALMPIQSISRDVRIFVCLFVSLFVRHTLETTLPEGLETSGRRAYR